MKYGIIYKEKMARSRPVIVEAPSFEALSGHPDLDFIDPYNCMVEAVVDFDAKRVIRSGMPANREVLAIVDPDMRQAGDADYSFWLRSMRSPEPRAAVVSADSAEKAMSVAGATALNTEPFSGIYVDSLIDFKEQAIRPVAMKADGTIIEVWDGDFGERTPGEWFEEEAQCQD
jgi:hypothetical protein